MLSILPRIGPALYKWEGILRGPVRQYPSAVAGKWLKEQVPPGTSVLVWQFEPLLYLHSDAKPVNRFYDYWYFDHISLAPPSPFQKYLDRIWHDDLKSNPPQYVLTRGAQGPDLQKAMVALGIKELLSEDYVELPEVAGYDVYRRVEAD